MGIRNIINSTLNSQTLILIYWTLNSNKIRKNSEIAKYYARNADFVFHDFDDIGLDPDPQLLPHHYLFTLILLWFLAIV